MFQRQSRVNVCRSDIREILKQMESIFVLSLKRARGGGGGGGEGLPYGTDGDARQKF